MNQPDFWQDKQSAKKTVAEYERLKEKKQFVSGLTKRNATVAIISGAGGLDAEDFASMLFSMYKAFIKKKGWKLQIVSASENDRGGIKNVVAKVKGEGAYGALRFESGVHRLVRQSPFNADNKRHTSFALVEVTPEVPDVGEVEIKDGDLDVEFSRSSGAGGQNVNRRETAVRVVHKPSGISVRSDVARTQKENRENALEILRGKLYHKKQQEKRAKKQAFSSTTSADNEWGNQMRSYVLHPYQKVVDHRTDHVEQDVESVLEDGELSGFIAAEANLTANNQ
jgi:peptide chain release factor 2